MTSSLTTPVLIVGAGPTGLTAAIALANKGVKVRVIDSAEGAHSGARGTAIMPRTQELLAILGVQPALASLATPPLQMAVYDPEDGKRILRTFEWSEAAPVHPTIPFSQPASIAQCELENILRRHLLEAHAVQVEWGCKLVGIRQDDKVVVTTVHPASPGVPVRDIESEYLIAADGGHGSSRAILGLSFLGETKTADRMWSATVEVPGFSREYWHRWGDFATAATSLKPINPGNRFQMLTLGPNLPTDLPQDVQGTQALFNSISQREDIKFENASCISEWRANIRMIDRLAVGRVFLAGDVAHCHSPAGGQGTNTAMQDSFNLAWKLALVILRKAVSERLLGSYEAERMPVIAEMLHLSNELHARAFTRPTSSALGSSESTKVSDPMLRSSELLQLGVNYRWSPIVLDHRDASEEKQNPYGGAFDTGYEVRVGDRAPYFGGVQDLFSLLREAPSHLILFFPATGHRAATLSTSNTQMEVVVDLRRWIEAGLINVAVIGFHSPDSTRGVQYLADPQGVIAESYGIHGGKDPKDVLVVLRPDGVLGAYVFDVRGVDDYFSLLGVQV
ncbi:FAD binding domain-containing protein [Roridomyces roridus]|uniref:FAD binding domain-containing protein n=1 Tax=Roridomyces roridus TaxID=1738132 RepID=A0AAD7B7S9_9AGAR|nr:FAD binding domain-containing protein [Roridomyces roridus]